MWNHRFTQFCKINGYLHEFSCPRTPQQNGLVERKNRTLQEAARTMLNEYNLNHQFWAKAINTANYIQNRILINKLHNKTPYELYYHKIPNLNYLKVFGCKVHILNTKDYLGKFTPKSNQGIFLGYSSTNRAFRVYN